MAARSIPAAIPAPGVNEPVSKGPDDVAKLLQRVDALERLLVCFRIGKSPTEKHFTQLDRTKAWADEIKARKDHER